MEKEWNLLETDKLTVANLAKELAVSESIAHLLVLRDIRNFEDAKLFFRPKLSDLHNPFLMKDMQKAIGRIDDAINNNENILVYGDYDVDGTTSVAMMTHFLKKYTANVEYYIPCRYNEGYGLSNTAIDYAKQNNYSLIITLDCGITAIEEIEYAKERNIDCIICDHHNTLKEKPKAIAILNPKQDQCNYPYKHLSGCGVGFKLIHGFILKKGRDIKDIIEYLDLLTISIAADIVPITGENRVFAFYGIRQINNHPRNGIKVLMEFSHKTSNLSVSDILFQIAPRINAAGRMDHASKAVAIFLENDYKKAKILAKNIEENNIQRRSLDEKITKEALQIVDSEKQSIVVFNNNWHKGVIGIVASRLIEHHYKPTIVFAEKDGLLTGSARSIHGFDIYRSILECSYLCEKFGGHKYAAGITIKKENLDKFILKFEENVSKYISKDQLSPKINIDLSLDIEDIDDKFYRIIKQFAPFGPKNPIPVFLSKRLIDDGAGRIIGKDKTHLKINIKRIKDSISAIGFKMAKYFNNINNAHYFDVCYSIEENIWNEKRTLQLVLKDLKINNEEYY